MAQEDSYYIEQAYLGDVSVDYVYELYKDAISEMSLYRDDPGAEEAIKGNISVFMDRAVPQTCLLLVWHKQTVVGFLAGLAAPHLLHPAQIVASEIFFWVSKEHRSKAPAAVRLVKAFETWAKEPPRNCSAVTLAFYRGPGEIDLHKFYSRFGYTPIETTYLKQLNR